MNKPIRYLQTYLIYGLPVVFASFVISSVWFYQHKHLAGISKLFSDLMGWNIMAWFAALVVYLILMVISTKVREQTLSRLANLNERDEREEYITGRASRATYISTLSLMILFLFFSMFSVSIYKLPSEKPHYSFNISMTYNVLRQSAIVSESPKEVMFDSKDYSLSTASIMLILLSWQLVTFNLAARREK